MTRMTSGRKRSYRDDAVRDEGPRSETGSTQVGWRIAAAIMSVGVVIALLRDLRTGGLGLRHGAPLFALLPMILFSVGGQRLLGRLLPMFRPKDANTARD